MQENSRPAFAARSAGSPGATTENLKHLPRKSSIVERYAGIAFVLLVAFNLRPAITSLSPFIKNLGGDFALSPLAVSILTTLPIISLGMFGLAAPLIARRIGLVPTLLVALILLILGIHIRTLGVVQLFAGSLLIGASLCILGVLSPVLIKRDYPNHIGMMMGLYAMLIGLGAAATTISASTLRSFMGGDWHAVLLLWSLPAILAVVVGLPLIKKTSDTRPPASLNIAAVAGKALAWQVTGYLATVAALAYAVIVWGPVMLLDRGLDVAYSGVVLTVCYLSQTVTGFFGSILASWFKDQRILVAIFGTMTLAGLLGYLMAPDWLLMPSSIILGLGQGGAFAVALSFLVLRSGSPAVAAQLSALAQGVGYVVGGLLGPFAVGSIYAASGSWLWVGVFYAAVTVVSLAFGLASGRKITIVG